MQESLSKKRRFLMYLAMHMKMKQGLKYQISQISYMLKKIFKFYPSHGKTLTMQKGIFQIFSVESFSSFHLELYNL
jgi:hypothetical protein